MLLQVLILTLISLLAALIALARRRIYPNPPALLLAAAPVLASLALLATTDALTAVLAVDALVVGVALLDLWSLPAPDAFTAERETPRVASLDRMHPVTLTLINTRRRAFRIWVRDDVPVELPAEPQEFSLQLAARTRAVLHYELHPLQRGAFRLECVHIRARSRWGLWQRLLSPPAVREIHVYPNLKQVEEYAVLARTNRLNQMGVRRTRRIGQDNEFESLRDYSYDDTYNHIDWLSTARRHRLTVREYQANQSQRLIFLVDCGRMMTNEAAGLNLLDHAFNSMLMLSHVALQRGDAVGLICFSDRVRAFVPPRGGLKHMNQLLHASFDRFPELVESRYDDAFLHLSAHVRKRSLVILISNVIDEVNSHQVGEYLSVQVGRHLPLGVLLRDHRLFDAVNAAEGPEEARSEVLFRAAAAADILTWRQQVLNDLEHRGVLALDVFPDQMTAPLINSYLDVKARHLL